MLVSDVLKELSTLNPNMEVRFCEVTEEGLYIKDVDAVCELTIHVVNCGDFTVEQPVCILLSKESNEILKSKDAEFKSSLN